MLIGTVREIKPQENRVGLVPSSVLELVAAGHQVLVESGAGRNIGFHDDDYRAAGADVVARAADVFSRAEMIVKVKEPQESEYRQLRPGQILFTYLHLAPDPEQARGLIESGCVAIAYETVMGDDGRSLPLLTPMSEVAGRLAAQVGAHYLMKHNGGMGRLMGGVPGVSPARVMVLGGGVAGFNAARVAIGMGADVSILERHPQRLRQLDDYFAGRAKVLYSESSTIEKLSRDHDVVIGAVLLPGAATPRLIRRDQLSLMRPGSVLVDIAIDQGGCFETSHPTTHADPVFTVDGVVHYCVANMPGAVPLTSALALNQAVLPYALKLANLGWKAALKGDPAFRHGLNVANGAITHPAVAQALGMPLVMPEAFF